MAFPTLNFLSFTLESYYLAMRCFWASTRILATSLRSLIISLSAAKSEVLVSLSKFSYQNEETFTSAGIIDSLPYAMEKGVFPVVVLAVVR